MGTGKNSVPGAAKVSQSFPDYAKSLNYNPRQPLNTDILLTESRLT